MDVDQVVARIEELLTECGGGPAEELVRLLMQLYGEALGRMVEMVRGSEYAERLTEDKLVGSLLLLHDLHPVDAGERLRRMLDKLGRGFDAHFSLEDVEDGIARIRVEPNGSGLPHDFGEVIERAAFDVAPDLNGVKIEGLQAEPLVQISLARSE